MKLVAANREKRKRNAERSSDEAMKKLVRENVKASDKRREAKVRYEARKRATEEEKRNEQE